MDITAQILNRPPRRSNDPAQEIATWKEELEYNINTNNPDDWNLLDTMLNQSQYGYIQLGMLLERIRNTCYWKLCGRKYASFKDWLADRMQLTVWQAHQYIDAANVAIYLSSTFTKLPRNFSQAVALIPAMGDGSIDSIWETVCKLPKITANAIKRIVNPDAIEKDSTKLPKHLRDRAAKQAARKGMTIDEYLADLIGQDEYQDDIIDAEISPEVITEPDPELGRVVDRLERSWKPNLIHRSVESFDNLMNNLVGNFIPRVQIE